MESAKQSAKPSGGTSRRQKKADTRASIKRAARARFCEHGYAATGVSDIAAEAGVAHGTLYVHFPTKDALLDELLEDFNRDFARRVLPIVEQAASQELEVIVRGVAETYIAHWARHKRFVECLAERGVTGSTTDALRDGMNPQMAALLSAALPAVSEKTVQSPEWDLLVHGLLAMWMRIGIRFLFCRSVTRRHAVDSLVAMTVGALATAVPTQPR